MGGAAAVELTHQPTARVIRDLSGQVPQRRGRRHPMWTAEIEQKVLSSPKVGIGPYVEVVRSTISLRGHCSLQMLSFLFIDSRLNVSAKNRCWHLPRAAWK